jgi:hypothetical protein
MALTHLKVQGNEYTFDLEKELTVGRLRQIKQWFGPQLGRYGTFFRALADMDPEAMLCVYWVARLSAGEQNVPEPNQIKDFSIADWDMEAKAVEPEEVPERPTEGEDAPTPDSMETPTNSDTDISGS